MRALRPAADPLKIPYLVAWAVVLGFILLWTAMWGINSLGARGLNTPIAFVSFLGIMFASYGPSRLIESGVLGSIYAALNLRSPIRGFGTGLEWHTRIVMIVLYVHLTVAFLLMTWPFAGNPGAFWYCLVGIITIVVTMQVYSIKTSKLIPIGLIVFVALCIFVAMLDTLGIDIPAFFGAIERPDAARLGAATPWWVIPAALAVVALLVTLFFLDKAKKAGGTTSSSSDGLLSKFLAVLVFIGIVGAGALVLNGWVRNDAACAGGSTRIALVPEAATSLRVVDCSSEVFVYTGNVLRYDVRFADQSSPRFVGRSPEDFVFIDRSFPGQPAHTLRVRPNRDVMRQAGLQTVELTIVPTDTYVGPVVRGGSASAPSERGLDWLTRTN